MNEVPQATRVRFPSTGHGSRLDGRYPGETMFSASLVAATVGAVAAMAYLGRLREALVAVVTLLVIPVLVKRPLILVFAYLLTSTNLFETIQLRYVTALQAGPVVLKVPDVLIIVMFVVAVVRLRKRHQRPMFLGFVILWCAYVAFQLMYGHFLLGETGRIEALTMPLINAKDLVGWVLYLLLVALIDTPRNLKTFMWFFLAIMVVAVLYQVAEYARGSRIIPFHVGASGVTTYFDFTYVRNAGGVGVPYLWSRASQVTVVGFLVSFAAVLGGRRFRVYGPLAAAGLLSIALTQIRAMYFGAAVGVLAVVGLYGWQVRRFVRVLALVGLLVVVVAVLTPLMTSSFGGDPTRVFLARAFSLTSYTSDGSWVYRVGHAKMAWDGIKQSPLTGFGWGRTYGRLSGESGLNIVLMHGFLGTLMILAMYLTVLVKAVRLGRGLKPSLEQSLLFGLVGAMVANLAMTPTSDVLISGGFAVVAAVFVDRISTFKTDGRLAGQSAVRPNGG